MPRTRSKRLITKTTSTGVDVEFKKCRKCMKDQRPVQYYNATDTNIDSDGLFSVCKTCLNSMFDTYLESEKSIEKAVLKMCRSLNIKYDETAIQAAIAHQQQLKDNGKIVPPFFGLYKFKLSTTLDVKPSERKMVDLTYQEVSNITISNTIDLSKTVSPEISQLSRFWGETYSEEDLLFLDEELFDWKRSYSCSNKGEEFILKELCYKSLELKKARIEGKSTDSILKSTQDIMKSGALTPAQANSLSEKNTSAFGVWLKEISEMRPEEWVEDKSIYKDIDNIEEYTEKNIISPMRALVTGSKEFTLDSEEIVDEEGE